MKTPSGPNFEHAIAAATHETLVRYKNSAYNDLYEKMKDTHAKLLELRSRL